MPQGIATAADPNATVLLAGFDAERTVVIADHQVRRAAAVTGGLVRPYLPGIDCPPAARHRAREPWQPPRWAARLWRLLKFAAPLVIGVTTVICAVVFLGVVNP